MPLTVLRMSVMMRVKRGDVVGVSKSGIVEGDKGGIVKGSSAGSMSLEAWCTFCFSKSAKVHDHR